MVRSNPDPVNDDVSLPYRCGSELRRHCQQRLSDAEREIKVLEASALRDFDADNWKTL